MTDNSADGLLRYHLEREARAERRRRSCRRRALARLVAFSAFALASAAASQSDSLFAPAGPERLGSPSTAGTAAADRTVLRHRLATIDFGLLERVRTAAARPGSTPLALTLNLFDGVGCEMVVDTVEPTFSGGYSISGRIAGEPPGSATLVVNGSTVAGSVRTMAGTWRISSAEGGRYAVSEMDPAEMEGSCEVVVPPGAGLRNEPRSRQ